ncbi:MAG: hypothetical protein ACLFQ9_05535 [Desulfobacterales bacterium]
MKHKDTTRAEKQKYTCSDYRAEMILVSLQRRLEQNDLSDSERQSLEAEIKRLKQEMGMS